MSERDIFIAALQQDDPAQRQAYLDEACAGQAVLREQVEGLLRLHANAGSFLEQPAVETGATRDDVSPGQWINPADLPPPSEGPGSRIGPYKLLEQIGEGGMGLVFVAEQQRPVKRRVALKVIKPGMDSRPVIARFEAERQALAMMDHAHIAKVYDGGATPEGRPYFVMELVKGTPITDYCDAHRLTTRQRLELFRDVCQAVQHAHQKGIIHRDLKPSNVLVSVHDVTAVVKVIDFGVAKAIGGRLTDKTVYTQLTQLIGTPLYMSPEQAGLSDSDVDTRSDVYSLGVLLYELLTGTTPFETGHFQAVGFDEMRRIIREDEPPRPSARLSTLRPAMLSTIAERRGLEPRRLSQQVRGELDWIVMKALEKDRGRRYESASALAADVQRYLDDEPVQAWPPSAAYRFRKFARRKKTALLVAAGVFLALAGMAGAIGWAMSDRLTRERERLAREGALDDVVRQTLDETGPLLEQGKWPEALALVERAEKLLATAGREDRPPRLLALQKDFAMAKRLEEIYGQGGSSEAEFYAGREQDERFARAFQEFGIDLEALPPAEAAELIVATSIPRALVQALDQWAGMRKRARGNEAYAASSTSFFQDPFWKKLVEVARRADPDAWRNRVREALLERDRPALEKLAEAVPLREVPPATAFLLGFALKDLGNLDKAMAVLREAHRHHPDDFWLNDTLGGFYCGCNPPRYDDAVRYLQAAVVLRPRSWYAHYELARTLERKGAHEEAKAEVAKVMEIEVERENAWEWNARGDFYRHFHEYAKAIAHYTRAIELKPDYAEAWWDRAWAYCDLHEYGKALADANRAIELDSKNSVAWSARGRAYYGLHQYDKALDDYSKCIKLDPKNAVAWNNRGSAYYQLHQYDKALDDFNKAIGLDPKHAQAWNGQGHVYFSLHQYDKALADYSKAIALEPKSAMLWSNRGGAYTHLHQNDKALADYSKAIELEPKLASAWNGRGNVYSSLNQYDKALADYSKAIELEPKDAVTWINRGWAYSQLRQYDKALADCNKAIELEPKDAHAWNERGNVYSSLNQYDKALADFHKAIELDSKNAVDWTNRAQAYYALHQYDKALADYSKAIDLDPKNAASWNIRGQAFANLGQCEKAVADFSEAVKLAPENPYLWNVRALARWEGGDHAGYRRDCAAMLQHFGRSPNPQTAYFTVVCCSRVPDAVEDWTPLAHWAEQTLAADAKNVDQLSALGAVLYRAGRFDEAARRLHQAEAAFQKAPVPSPAWSIAYTWLFLALTHGRLGHADQAGQWLDKAVREIDNPPAATAQVNRLWIRQQAFRLLRREAEQQLRGSTSGPRQPGKKAEPPPQAPGR
jgi:tetratricopeptide (TPR) repeat protein/tRNA A-37 threonylcarbamoyl transferase component Bud32